MSGKIHSSRCRAWVAAVLLLLCYYALLPSGNVSLKILQSTLLVWVIPVLVAAVLYFRGLQAGAEYKLLLAFWLWFWFTRVLNGSPALDHDFRLFLDLSLMLPFFALGPALSKAERRVFLDWLSAMLGVLYLIPGVIALILFFRGTEAALPLIRGTIRIIRDAKTAQIVFFGVSPTISACWFLIALFLMIYQLFHCENKLWRVPIVLSAVIDLLVVILSRSKAVLLCAALAFALLAAMLVQLLLKHKTRFFRITLMLFAAVLVLGAAYRGSLLCANAMTVLSDQIRSPAEAEDGSTGPEGAVWIDDRSSLRPMRLSSGRHEVRLDSHTLSAEQNDPSPEPADMSSESFNRMQIWHGAFQTIRAIPSILWRGHICDSVMIAAYPFVTTDGTGPMPWQFYNSMIQVLMSTGIPGLILALLFLVSVLYQGIRFSICVEAPLDVRLLVLPLLAMIPYFMLESCLFTAVDLRTLFYFLMCGLVIGFAKES